MTASGRMPRVGFPEMRRGSLTLVTRPSTMAPAGITVLPSTTTGCVMRARKGSPTLLLKVARVVSSLTIRAVPAGTGAGVWATSVAASNAQGNSIHVFMRTSKIRKLLSTVAQVWRGDKRRSVHREPAEIRGCQDGRMDTPNVEIASGIVFAVTLQQCPSDIIVGFTNVWERTMPVSVT